MFFQTYAEDTFHEVLGWYGLEGGQQHPSEDDASPTSNPSAPIDLTNSTGTQDTSNHKKTSSKAGSGSNNWSNSQASFGKKHIGVRYLFPPLPNITLFEVAKIWVERHDNKYFVGLNQDQLKDVDDLVRPLHPISTELYKLHMNRCVTVFRSANFVKDYN